jgi:hypothetical protein
LNVLATITAKKAGFRSLGDTWADTTTSHGRLMLAVLGGLSSPTLVAEEVLRQPMAHVIVMKFPNLQPQAARSKCA